MKMYYVHIPTDNLKYTANCLNNAKCFDSTSVMNLSIDQMICTKHIALQSFEIILKSVTQRKIGVLLSRLSKINYSVSSKWPNLQKALTVAKEAAV